MTPKPTPAPRVAATSFETTQPPFPPGHDLPADAHQWRGALILLWSREEPQRVGEVCLFSRETGHRLTLGRGESSPTEPIASFGRQRPGEYVTTGPLRARSISRRQLRLEVLSDGRVALENVGSCPLLFDGRPTRSVILRDGDMIELQNELVLMLTTRPAELAPLPDAQPLPPFGEVDELGLVGESPQLWSLRSRIAALGPLNTHVLVLGPSGAGKELVAQGLHKRSPRARKALVSRSAATLPEGLITSELFGNIAHYPQHGMPERPGLIGAASDGTLLLDEFGELPHPLQTQLLRVLDQGEYQRLGETRLRHANFRLIAATNRHENDLKEDVRARFSARIVVPGLNERKEDIPLLLRHLLHHHVGHSIRPGATTSHETSGQPPSLEISAELVQSLVSHEYRTHIRELNELLLESLLERQGSRLRTPSRLKNPAASGPPGHGAVNSGRARNLARADLHETAAHEAVGPETAGLVTDAISPLSARLSREEQHRLQLLRRFDFRIGELMTSGEYPANRQTADLHLRQLMTRALLMAEGDIPRATTLLTERGSEAARLKLTSRMTTWRDNLRVRQQSPEFQGKDGLERLEKALLTEYRGFREIVELLHRLEGWERQRG